MQVHFTGFSFQGFYTALPCLFIKVMQHIVKKIVICLPMEHLGVLINSLKRVRAFQIELEFESVGF